MPQLRYYRGLPPIAYAVPDTASSGSGGGLSGGAIAGIVVGVLAFVAIAVLIGEPAQ